MLKHLAALCFCLNLQAAELELDLIKQDYISLDECTDHQTARMAASTAQSTLPSVDPVNFVDASSYIDYASRIWAPIPLFEATFNGWTSNENNDTFTCPTTGHWLISYDVTFYQRPAYIQQNSRLFDPSSNQAIAGSGISVSYLTAGFQNTVSKTVNVFLTAGSQIQLQISGANSSAAIIKANTQVGAPSAHLSITQL